MQTKQLKSVSGGHFLYIVEATTDSVQWVKIGITTELLGRVGGIACGCPIPIDVVWYREIGRAEIADWAEIAVHAALADRWSSGEWFEIPSDEALRAQIDVIASRFAKPQPWSALRLDESPWRKRKNRAEKLAALAERRADGIESARKRARESPMRMELSAQAIRDVYKSK